MIYVLSGPSGAGKTSILKELLRVVPGLCFSVSATTRQLRNGEKDGVDYHFMSKEDFQAKIKNDEFVEWEEFFGNYYGTLKSEIKVNLDKPADTVLDIDVKGALQIKKIFPEAVIIFISVPGEDFLQRLRNRKTDSEEQIVKRADRIKFELGLKNNFDYVIENQLGDEGLQKAVNEITEIINNNRNKQNGN